MIVADFHTLSSFRSPAIRRPAALDPASDDGDDAELWTFNDFVVHGHRRSDEPARPRKAETNSLQDPPSTLQNRHISCIVIFSHISIYIYIYIYIYTWIYLPMFICLGPLSPCWSASAEARALAWSFCKAHCNSLGFRF